MIKNKPLLITGCQRSGTTILSACLGRHPDISMLVESTDYDVLKGIGKKYNGNKLCLYSQIRPKTRASKFGYFINRIVNFNRSYFKRRPFPTSKMSINDYKNLGAKIVYIIRNKKDTVKSMIKRAGFSKRLASKHYDKAVSYIDDDGMLVHYEGFVENNEVILRDICDYLELKFNKRMLEGDKYNEYYEYKR